MVVIFEEGPGIPAWLADFMILAIYAAEVTTCKENIAYTIAASDYRLFSPMDAN